MPALGNFSKSLKKNNNTKKSHALYIIGNCELRKNIWKKRKTLPLSTAVGEIFVVFIYSTLEKKVAVASYY